jgi:glycine C-acetyltransferase
MMNINLEKASFKDFENMAGKNPFEWAAAFDDYVSNWAGRGHWNYRQESLSGCMPEIELTDGKRYVALVLLYGSSRGWQRPVTCHAVFKVLIGDCA